MNWSDAAITVKCWGYSMFGSRAFVSNELVKPSICLYVCIFVCGKALHSPHTFTPHSIVHSLEIFQWFPTSSRCHPKGGQTLRSAHYGSLSQYLCKYVWVLSIKDDSVINGLERHQWLVKRVNVACFYRWCYKQRYRHTQTHTLVMYLWVCVCVYCSCHWTTSRDFAGGTYNV